MNYYELRQRAERAEDALAELQRELEQRTLAWALAADERDKANGERDEARALLRELEWCGHNNFDEACCPLCRSRLGKEPHDFDCRIGITLRETK